MGPVVWSRKRIYSERASINSCHCPLVFTICPINPFQDTRVKQQTHSNKSNISDIFSKKRKEEDMHTATITTACTSQLRAHTSKGAIYQISRHLISSFTSSANMKNAEIFTYPSIHRFGCVAYSCRGLYGCAGYRILFSWGDLFSFQV